MRLHSLHGYSTLQSQQQLFVGWLARARDPLHSINLGHLFTLDLGVCGVPKYGSESALKTRTEPSRTEQKVGIPTFFGISIFV